MFKRVSVRLRGIFDRAPQPEVSRAPVQSNTYVSTSGDGGRRGVTRRTIEVVRIENRAANKRARASRKANRGV
jgi:hypothetical protein